MVLGSRVSSLSTNMNIVGELGSRSSLVDGDRKWEDAHADLHPSSYGLVGEKLAWKNHIQKGRRIFSNYQLYGFPHTRVTDLSGFESMRNGFFAGDELWLWLDARTSSKQMNKVSSDILLKNNVHRSIIEEKSQTGPDASLYSSTSKSNRCEGKKRCGFYCLPRDKEQRETMSSPRVFREQAS